MTGDEAIEAGHGYPVFPTQANRPACPTQVKCRVCKSPVIPKAHPDKDPCRGECGREGHGFLDATTDPDIIRGWWARWPDANVAIATGYPGPDVLDVDVKELGSGFAALNILKRAGMLKGAQALIRTPSGGIHVYFAGSTQGCHSIPRLYLDFKATGGYVLAPPSLVHGKPYELVERRPGTSGLDWDAVKQLLDPPRPLRTFRTGTWDGGDLPAGVTAALNADVNGDRSAALHRLIGACVRSGMNDTAIHELAATYPPAVDKYGARLPAEVDRSLRRIGAA